MQESQKADADEDCNKTRIPRVKDFTESTAPVCPIPSPRLTPLHPNEDPLNRNSDYRNNSRKSSNESLLDIEDKIDQWLGCKGITPATPSLKKMEYFENIRKSTFRSLGFTLPVRNRDSDIQTESDRANGSRRRSVQSRAKL